MAGGTQPRLTRRPSRRLVAFIRLQLVIPAALLLYRALTGLVEWYGWGWQMFS